MTMARRLEAMTLLAALVLLGAAGGLLAWRVGGETRLGEYVTSLRGRTASQRHNATLAATRLDGSVIPPGAVLSFNRTVGTWTADRGYRRAPVSYDGELLAAWGGGVCQTSTTLYAAALLAGLEIRERHRHEYPPRYIVPGRDAAVAYPSIDLVLGNPYPWPVRVSAAAGPDALRIAIIGEGRPPCTIAVTEEVRAVSPAASVVVTERSRPGPRRVLNPGEAGYEVAVYRTYRRHDALVQRELVSRDSYPAVTRVVELPRAPVGR